MDMWHTGEGQLQGDPDGGETWHSRRRTRNAGRRGARAASPDRLVAVVLFGSRARGEGSETSDWDLLVIAEGLPPRHSTGTCT